MIQINAIGKQCPMPVIMTRKAIHQLDTPDIIEVLVDNEIAVENVKKTAIKSCTNIEVEELEGNQFKITLTVGKVEKSIEDQNTKAIDIQEDDFEIDEYTEVAETNEVELKKEHTEAEMKRILARKQKIAKTKEHIIVVIDSERMGKGDESLGKTLMKGFVYAVTELDDLPNAMIFYNSGAMLTIESSSVLEDLKFLDAQGVEILTCGMCLKHYGVEDSLAVGTVTNMYSIVETMAAATKTIRP